MMRGGGEMEGGRERGRKRGVGRANNHCSIDSFSMFCDSLKIAFQKLNEKNERECKRMEVELRKSVIMNGRESDHRSISGDRERERERQTKHYRRLDSF